MNARVLNAVTGRLSLRPPQEESLRKLAQTIAAAPDVLEQDRDVASILSTLKAEFPTLEDFERDFPSLCFALATGVGKTRLMGAFISYLYLAHGIQNFFVLAPNLTIYDKLITDFTPNTPKYVFKGIAEFSTSPPEIITGDNYDQRNISGGALFSSVRINIFNISKINSEVRGGKEPRIKRMKEVLGDSYFNYLAELPDLVLLMDESHRYRGGAGIRSINELKPLLGLELTATPFVEAGSGKTVAFKNVVMDYPLARAMDDGFVKEPAVVTQRNFDPKQYTPEQIEQIKLEDGIRLHEATKVELVTYARENDTKLVKPFMLVIARDTTHAGQLMSLIQSDAFYSGRYKDHVIQVDSSKTGAEEEEMIRRLLAVESVDEPTEIVIHVNMLKEGWDVTNLYTIVPLRAANARTLIEQSIGRGLRLPYGKRTGVDAVDRLNIVAHDKFQEIVDEANKANSPIRLRQLILEAPENDVRTTSVQIQSTLHSMLGQTEAQLTAADPTPSATALQATGSYPGPAPKPLFTSAPERAAALEALQVMEGFAHQPGVAANRQALLHPTMQQQIVAAVQERLAPAQQQLLPDESPVDIAAVVAKATATLVAQTIDIPRIVVVPSGDVTTGFKPFSLELKNFNLKPNEREILIQGLKTGKQDVLNAEASIHENRLEDYIVHSLIDFDDVDYDTHAALLYDLAGQVVKHFESQKYSEDEIRNILDGNRKLIANEIHSQMMLHFWEKATGYEVKVSCGFTPLRPCNVNASEAEAKTPRSYRETVTEVGKIKQMLFGGFSKCLYPLQKFDSDTERRFGVILERDAEKWFRPVKGQFQLYYRLGSEQPEYVPDFVVETADAILMCETKARTDMEAADVQAKAQAAATWCQNATAYSASHGGKPWHYLLIPHDDIAENKQLSFFMRYEFK
jgi:type III restriction enzyme